MRLYGDDFIIDETIWVGHVVDGRTFSLEGRSGKARVRLLHVFKLRDGLIAKENVWFDFDDLARQLGTPVHQDAGAAAAEQRRPSAGAPRRR